MSEEIENLKSVKAFRRATEEPSRYDYAKKHLSDLGCELLEEDKANKSLTYLYKKLKFVLYPYTGWWSGKGLGSGRGVNVLIKKLKSMTEIEQRFNEVQNAR